MVCGCFRFSALTTLWIPISKNPVIGCVFFNALSMRLADAVLKQYNGLTCSFVFHDITNIDACTLDQQGTARVNVVSVCAVINDLIDHGIMSLFASSDAM